MFLILCFNTQSLFAISYMSVRDTAADFLLYLKVTVFFKKCFSAYQFSFEHKFGAVGLGLELGQLFLHSIFLGRACSQLFSQISLLLPELDIVLT